MGNSPSTSRKSRKSKDDVASRAQQVAAEFQAGIQSGIKKLEENDHPAAQLIDSVCGPYLDADMRQHRRRSSYEDSSSDDDSEFSEDETTATDYSKRRSRRKRNDEETVGSSSYLSQSDYESTVAESKSGVSPRRHHKARAEDSSVEPHSALQQKPLASSFAKRCYFTKAGIGKTVQHYEGLTLTGNVVLMLASAMKLKGCPTICDEDLRRVEQTYPNQFSRLPDELLLSSGWRRISKYCHFSNKPIPDGVPFFHSKQRLHPAGGYYFLLAAAVGMVRPIDVEPLNRDTLVLLETDYPTACDAAPQVLISDPTQWTLVDRFCFFSGGPINTDEDVYYQADFDGNPIYMLAFLSPSLTPEELYKLPNGLETVAQVHEVESIYDLTERDFEDLKLYHLGPCRALPPYILQPQAWTKVLPPPFLQAREKALLQAVDYDPATAHQSPFMHQNTHMQQHMGQSRPLHEPMYGDQDPGMPGEPGYYDPSYMIPAQPPMPTPQGLRAASPGRVADGESYGEPYHGDEMGHDMPEEHERFPPMQGENRPHFSQAMQGDHQNHYTDHHSGDHMGEPLSMHNLQRHVEEEGAFVDSTRPMDEAAHVEIGMDPPEDEPPSLSMPESEDAQQSDNLEPSDEEMYQSTNVATSTPGEAYFEDRTLEPTYTEESGPSVPSPDKTEESASDYFNEFQTETPTVDTGAHYFDESSKAGDSNYYVTSQDEQPLSPVSENDMLSPGPSTDENFKSPASQDKPPRSPGSDFSRTSAMKGAQELLKRNRQRRLEAARKRNDDEYNNGPDDEDVAVPPDSESGATWESGSEMTSIVSGSSVWTDNVSNPDRGSRRALILQMAKARMRNQKSPGSQTEEEEKKFQGEDIDLTEDLD